MWIILSMGMLLLLTDIANSLILRVSVPCKPDQIRVRDKCRDKFVETKTCGAAKFLCESGDCIDEYLVCDGAKDCKDGSDETETICPFFECPPFAFRCKYGACVNADSKCNGISECADGSDEELCGTIPVTAPSLPPLDEDEKLSTPGPPSEELECKIPSPPEHGAYTGVPPNANPNVGQVVQDGAVLIYTCDTNYGLNSNQELDYILCFNREWIKNFPVCLRTCPELPNSIEAKCEYGNTEVNCSKPMLHGTRVTASCKDNFESNSTATHKSVILCNSGTWDQDFIQCVPECGKLIGSGKPFIVKGVPAKLGSFPWHVAIYRKETTDSVPDYACGGSILNMNTVLSAAHCFTEDNGGALKDISLFKIAAGKYFRLLNDERDNSTSQIRSVKKIQINENFKGIYTNYRDDIAVVILDEPFEVSFVVQPVCVDWHNDFEADQLRSNSTGDVAGWGLTEENGKPSEELQQLRLPYIANQQCYAVVPLSFYSYVTADKFCAGNANGSSVCLGDSGGGLVFLRNSTGRYYIRGIVSSGPGKGSGCDAHKYSLFTNVSLYLRTIIRIMSEHKI